MRALMAIAMLLSLGFSAKPASACDCEVPPLDRALDQADAIFEGRVARIEGPQITLRVTQHWKGVGDVEEVVLETGPGTCALSLDEGESYLIFAAQQGTRLHTNICDRSNSVAEAEADLAILGPGAIPFDPSTAERARVPDLTPDEEDSAGCSVSSGGGWGWAVVWMSALCWRRRFRFS